MSSSKRIVLVTGAHGFLGRHVLDRLSQSPDVMAIGIARGEADLTIEAQACTVVRRYGPDSIIHLAARCGGIGINQRRPATFIRDNSMMALNLVDAAKLSGVKKFVMVGSVCQYPEHAATPFREEDIWNGYPEPTNAAYGIAKRLGMALLQSYAQQYGLNGVFLVPANLYGPGDNFNPETSHVIPAIIAKTVEAVRRGEASIRLWGTGTATRDFLYVEDAADAIVRAEATLNNIEAMNLGTGRAVTIAEVATLIIKSVTAAMCAAPGVCAEIEWDDTRPNGQLYRRLDTSMAERLMGWTARTQLEAGIDRAVEAHLQGVV